ncbi:MAG: hypothetical protein H7Y89_04805 [Steroidobacteraceae bacterium]|nr:hypothetical protein [Steroidobacteraceae bacterium]
MDGALWVELSGEIIIARVRGEPTVELLADCQRQVVELAREAGRGKALYDVLEMHPPIVDVSLSQRALAYLARLAFGEGDYRVFYNDIVAALKWLTAEPAAAQLTRVK